jgi:hypothetical protein
LKGLLNRARSLTLEEFKRRWLNFVGSTDPFIKKQGGSLAYCCANFDQFINGPVQDKRASPDPASADYEVTEDIYAN